MIFLQIALAMALLFVSLLLFVMIRQIGVIAQRIPKKTDDNVVNPLMVGTTIPVREVETFDHKSRIVFSSGMQSGTLLLFASFSCPVCNQLLRQLSNTPKEVKNRLILFLLDTEIERRHMKEIRKRGLQSFPIVEAYELANQFRIWRAPFVYVVDEEGTVLDTIAVVSTDDLVALTRKHFGTATQKEERSHVKGAYSNQPRGHLDGSVGDFDVAKVHTP